MIEPMGRSQGGDRALSVGWIKFADVGVGAGNGREDGRESFNLVLRFLALSLSQSGHSETSAEGRRWLEA
jgi:hypothetical protein